MTTSLKMNLKSQNIKSFVKLQNISQFQDIVQHFFENLDRKSLFSEVSRIFIHFELKNSHVLIISMTVAFLQFQNPTIYNNSSTDMKLGLVSLIILLGLVSSLKLSPSLTSHLFVEKVVISVADIKKFASENGPAIVLFYSKQACRECIIAADKIRELCSANDVPFALLNGDVFDQSINDTYEFDSIPAMFGVDKNGDKLNDPVQFSVEKAKIIIETLKNQ